MARSTKHIAVDIALIPSEAIISECLDLQKSLGEHDPQIRIDQSSKIPHITLAMAIVEEKDLPAISNEMKALGHYQEYIREPLKQSGIYRTQSDLGTIVGINFHRSQQILEWQQASMSLLDGYAKGEPSIETLADPNDAHPATLDWIRGFPNHATAEAYQPHITFGFTQLSDWQGTLPAFRPAFLGLYQLGGFCTCQIPIAKLDLKSHA